MKLCGFDVGLNQPFFLIAGPCVVESEQLQLDVAGQLFFPLPCPVHLPLFAPHHACAGPPETRLGQPDAQRAQPRFDAFRLVTAS